jgi:Domain of unknown function (DUF4388)
MPTTTDPSPRPPDASAPLAFSGPITAITIPSLLHSICATRETGLLILREGKLEKSAYVQEGQLVFARSNDPDDRLGELLLERGLLSIRGLEACTEEVSRSGSKLGGVLVEKGLITASDLIGAVREQVQGIVHSLFLWTRGDYSFLSGPLPTKEVITLRIDTMEIIRQGIGRIQTWSRIRAAVGNLDTCYQSIPGFEEKLRTPLSIDEIKLLQFCTAPMPVGAICDTLPGNNFELCRTIWAMLVMGALRRMGTTAA